MATDLADPLGLTPARGCGSPIRTATGSTAFPPKPEDAASRTWKCGTGAAPGCVDWFRKANDGGLNHPPLQNFSHNQIGIAVVMLPPNRLRGHRRWTSLERDARILEPNH